MAATGSNNARKGQAKGKASAKGRSKAAQAAVGLRANEGRAAEAVEVAPLLGEGSGRDIAGVILAVVAVASFIAVVSPSSAPVTSAIAGFYHLGFGLGGYLLPLVLLGCAAMLFIKGSTPVSARTCAGAVLIFCSAVAMLSLAVPGTELSSDAMFIPQNLSSSGGYLGAFIASALQGALGKAISYVVLVGFVVLGLVIIGFSISDVARSAAERVERLAQRRHIDVNDSPWGDSEAASVAPARRTPRKMPRPVKPKQGRLFDGDGTAETTFLGNQTTTVLGADDEPDTDDDPFVDVSAQVKAEQAKTTLIPVEERFAPTAAKTEVLEKPARAPKAAGSALDIISGARSALKSEARVQDADSAIEPQDVLPWDEPVEEKAEARRTAKVAKAEGAAKASMRESAPEPDAEIAAQPVPDFLRKAAAGASAAKASQAASAPASAAPQSRPAPARPLPANGTAAPATSVLEEEGETRQLPPVSMLRHNPAAQASSSSSKELEQTAEGLQSTLQEFGLHSRVVGWIAGPTVTTFKVQPGEGERVSRITSLEDDIALSLATDSVRIFAPIPGTSLVGIEIPNRTRQTVAFGDILPYVQGGPLEFALGRDAEGQPMVADLAKMPHLLIAGTTGSGKSVVISSILMSLLMRTFPEDVRLIMIDPKRVEFAPYDGLPHLYVPVVTEPKQAASALQWAVSEMERRLKVFERIGVRKISTFNEKQAAGEFEKYDNSPAKMPYLVIVIDELSDLMMVAGKDVEASIVRIAQLGRAAGIHMIVATQRPSSNVVTGLIKANITNRIGLTVATGIDSRVILDQTGAEKLIGQGDMLFSRVDWGKPKRIQGCYVSDEEIFSVVEFVKDQSPADYHEEILSAVSPAALGGAGGGSGAREASDDDPLIWEAARIVVESQLGSTSGLQRRLKVGYARAGRIMDMLEEKGVVGPPDGSKPREVLLDEEGLAALEAVEARMADEDEFGGF